MHLQHFDAARSVPGHPQRPTVNAPVLVWDAGVEHRIDDAQNLVRQRANGLGTNADWRETTLGDHLED